MVESRSSPSARKHECVELSRGGECHRCCPPPLVDGLGPEPCTHKPSEGGGPKSNFALFDIVSHRFGSPLLLTDKRLR